MKAKKTENKNRSTAEQSDRRYRKVPECKYPNMYGCSFCEYNEVPGVFDGGCKLTRHKPPTSPTEAQ